MTHDPMCFNKGPVRITFAQDDWGRCWGCEWTAKVRRDALDKALEALIRQCDQLYVEGRISTMGQAAIEATINALRGES